VFLALVTQHFCGSSPAGITDSNPALWMDISLKYECCVLSSRRMCDGPIPHPEQSYRVCVSLSFIRCNNNPLHLRWVGRIGQTKKERKLSSMQSACAVVYCHLWPVCFYHIFPHYLVKVRFSGKKVFEHKMCVFVFSTNFVWNISHSKNNSGTNSKFLCQQMHSLLKHKMLQLTLKISLYMGSYMFRSVRTIIRERTPDLAKVTVLVELLVKILL
jgi:hypothetical protein